MSRKRRPSVAAVGRYMAAKDDQIRSFAVKEISDDTRRIVREVMAMQHAFAILRQIVELRPMDPSSPELLHGIDALQKDLAAFVLLIPPEGHERVIEKPK